MAALGTTYRNEDAPSQEFDLIPDKTQATMQVVEADVGSTRNNDGRVLSATVEIMDGPYENRRIWLRFNISNPNATAQTIALQQLAQLAGAIGLPGVSDTDELLWKPFLGTVSVQKNKDGNYPDQNGIRKFSALNGAPVGAGRAQPAHPAQRQSSPPPSTNGGRPGGTGGRPWGNGQRASA